jgi:SHS2 domain-containing protein
MTHRYGSFPTTADVGVWATASSNAELFEAVGLGLFALMTDLRTVRATEERIVEATGADPTSLLANYLNELLVLEDSEGFLVRSIHARPVGSPPTALLATVKGERFDPERHPRHMDVKAVTLHRLSIDLTRHRARVIVDI